jgi:uncharacterized membrane protein
MTRWERYWFGPVAAVRPYVLERVVLFLLALDVWTQCVPHGARYGAGGFNVAHFAWLDATQPLPSPSLHVGLMLIVGGLAWVIACTGGTRALRVLLVVLYTYGWAMSRLDAYQHHYLLSLLLGGFVLFPQLRATEVLEHEPRRVSAWAFVLVAVNVAIVYVFAAATKSEAGWASGAVLRQVTGGSRWFRDGWSWLLATGLGDDVLWEAMARAVALLQVLIAVAYVGVVRADASDGRRVRLLAWGALGAAVGFHGSLLLFALNIRWFSYYMIAIAGASFLPETALQRLVALATFPARRLSERAVRVRRAAGWRSVAIVSSGACIVALVGAHLDLPGATTAGLTCGGAMLTMAALAVTVGRDAERVRHAALAAAGGALALAAAVHVWPVRFEYYLYLVADLQRRGDPAQVLAAYEKAEPYAPAGQSRRPQIDALRSRLEGIDGRRAASSTERASLGPRGALTFAHGPT